jgi:hypothetical protein
MGRGKGQSRDTGNIGYTRRRTKTHKTKSTSLYTNYVNKIWTLLQTTGGKHEPNIILCGNRNNNKYTVQMGIEST